MNEGRVKTPRNLAPLARRVVLERGRHVALVGSIWIVMAAVLSELTSRVRDWVHADEILYERLAISIARTHSIVPRVNGFDVHSVAQLYPLLISPIFAHGLVPDDLRAAEILNAWLMTSACIPAYLLARRVTGLRWAGYLVAVLTAFMPWILYASMLMTEVVAYPVFVWALLAVQRTTTAPSWWRDVVAVLALALAYVARTELIVLVVVLPLAIVAYEVGRGPGGLRRAWRAHRMLVGLYALAVAGAGALWANGSLSSVAGIYGNYASNTGILPSGFFGSVAEHVATFSLAFGVLPLVVGVAWLIANLVRRPESAERHAFACIGALAATAVVLQATNFDVREVGYVYDRYLIYLVPVVLLGAVCAALDARAPRWSLLFPAALVACGYAFGALSRTAWGQFDALLPDTPISGLYRPIVDGLGGLTEARIALATGALAAAGLFAFAAPRLPRARTAVVVALLVLLVPTTTSYVWVRFFGANDFSLRPVTNPGSDEFTWVDQSVGGNAEVASVLYPVSSDWYVNQRIWRDYQFWNRSLDRSVGQPGIFDYTGRHYPKTGVRFDPHTGVATVSPARYVLEANQESRFRISGNALVNRDGLQLIDAGSAWRTDWISSGLYDDGWTRPGVTARVRVFAAPDQRAGVVRTLTFGLRPPDDVASRPFELTSNTGAVRGTAASGNSTFASIAVCVPSGGFGDVRLSTPDASSIPGDQRSAADSAAARTGGLFVSQIGLADELGGSC
jgi:hypothetical protein